MYGKGGGAEALCQSRPENVPKGRRPSMRFLVCITCIHYCLDSLRRHDVDNTNVRTYVRRVLDT